MRRCFLLLVDGLRPDVAEAELAAGRLPHLAELVAEGGVARGVTAFPSTTSVSYLPFLTGCTPGGCNVPSIRWMDRARYRGGWWRDRDAVRSYCGYQAGRLDGDIAPDVRTIFELVPESLALFTMISRGLTPARTPPRASGASGERSRITCSGTSRPTTPSQRTCSARRTSAGASCSLSSRRWTGTPTRWRPTGPGC